MKDQYKVVDTNVYLLDAAEALKSFAPKKPGIRNNIIIPYMVIEEIDKFKNEDYTSRGRQAKIFNSKLKKLIEHNGKDIQKGIHLADNHVLRVEFNYDESLEQKLQLQYNESNDNIILSVAQTLHNKYPGDVEVVTNDNNMYIKASAIGLDVSDWKAARSITEYEDIYQGWQVLEVDPRLIQGILGSKTGGVITIDEVKDELGMNRKPHPNEYFFLYAKGKKPFMVEGIDREIPDLSKLPENSNAYAFARYHLTQDEHDTQGLHKINSDSYLGKGIMGVKPFNMEQLFALDALLNPNINFVSLIGEAGTGKTLLSIAAGMHQWSVSPDKKKAQHIYNPVLLSKPMIGLKGQKDPIGFFPGSKNEKMMEWLMPIYDNIENILKPAIDLQLKNNLPKNEIVEFLLSERYLVTQPLHLVRGRSFHDTFLVMDEAQNMDPFEVKALLTRPAKGTKMILTGDAMQIDKQGLNATTNGLCYSAERFKHENISATINLTQGERSELATLAAKLL